ncbi:hypothetical protein SSS_05311 [Sarcoptes scabiei]|uniref:Uncharacterized protein n=1 Tax=Sarcoptes scabiei TaxID=52283 RepID=A0A834R7V1_SARSC|nr:hypothetical protein SSS_05311 [Sarcoptes scabiei]
MSSNYNRKKLRLIEFQIYLILVFEYSFSEHCCPNHTDRCGGHFALAQSISASDMALSSSLASAPIVSTIFGSILCRERIPIDEEEESANETEDYVQTYKIVRKTPRFGKRSNNDLDEKSRDILPKFKTSSSRSSRSQSKIIDCLDSKRKTNLKNRTIKENNSLRILLNKLPLLSFNLLQEKNSKLSPSKSSSSSSSSTSSKSLLEIKDQTKILRNHSNAIKSSNQKRRFDSNKRMPISRTQNDESFEGSDSNDHHRQHDYLRSQHQSDHHNHQEQNQISSDDLDERIDEMILLEKLLRLEALRRKRVSNESNLFA